MGRPPISTIGLGFKCVSSEIRVPNPPAKITAFMLAMGMGVVMLPIPVAI